MSDVISEVVLGSFWLMLPALGPNRKAKVLIENYARVRVFWAFDRLSSVSGSNVMIKNKKIN